MMIIYYAEALHIFAFCHLILEAPTKQLEAVSQLNWYLIGYFSNHQCNRVIRYP